MVHIRTEVIPFVLAVWLLGLVITIGLRWRWKSWRRAALLGIGVTSKFNQHNKILIEGSYVRCLVHQIVGPVCRRVVYWPDHEKPQEVAQGERIGMMKFGSRLDMIFPKADVAILVKPGQRVKAGETMIGTATRTEREEG